VPCASQVWNDAGSTRSIGYAGATWRRRHFVRNDLTAEPPAHCRLVSSHDLFLKTVAFRLYRSKFRISILATGESDGSPANLPLERGG
jgi:hypothetical protein